MKNVDNMDMWFQFCRALIGSSIIPSCWNFSVGSKKCVRTESAFLKTSINYRNFHMLISNVVSLVWVVVVVVAGGSGGPQPSLPGPRLEAAILGQTWLGFPQLFLAFLSTPQQPQWLLMFLLLLDMRTAGIDQSEREVEWWSVQFINIFLVQPVSTAAW